MLTASHAAPSRAIAPLLMLVAGFALLSATGTPTPKTVRRLAEAGVPQEVIAPFLHAAPLVVAALGFLLMRRLAAGRGPQLRALIYAGSGAVIGFITAVCLDLFTGVEPALERVTGPLRDSSSLDIAAWSMSGTSLFMAALMALISVFGSPAARAVAFEDADPECTEVRGRDRVNLGVGAAGLLGQGLFVGALALAHQVDPRATSVLVGVSASVTLGAALFAWSSLVLWRGFDEMLRRVVMDAYAWSGIIATIGCLVWAVLESLTLAPPLTAYGAVVALVALQTFVTLGVSSSLGASPQPARRRPA